MTHYESFEDLPDDPDELSDGDTFSEGGIQFSFIGGSKEFSINTLREFLSSAVQASQGALDEFNNREGNEEGQLAVVTQYHSAMDNFVHLNGPLLAQYVMAFLGRKAVSEAEGFLSVDKEGGK